MIRQDRDLKLSALFALLTCLVSAELRAQERGPLTPAPAERRRCELPSDELVGEVRLEADCYYRQAFVMDEPNTSLDCRGAELRGRDGEYIINIKRDADGASVTDCYLTDGKGIAVRVRKKREGETDDEVRALAPQGVTLSRLQITRSENVGVHLLPHTVGVTIRDSIISDQDGVGIYMSPYGRGHQVINNLISNNGHLKADGSPRIGWYRREGIAIDASSEHVIRGNEITDNAFGGILLYKNCWEHAAENPDTWPRTDHARANLIEGNTFGGQPFGVWVAARQSRDLTLMGCGDPTPYSNPISVRDLLPERYYEHSSAFAAEYITSFFFASIWPDFAEDNVIRGNRFEVHSAGALRVEDDGTEVTDNLFVGDFDYLFLGAPFRALLLGQPIQSTVISGNSYHSPEGRPIDDHLVLMEDEHINTTLTENYRACLDPSGALMRHGEELSYPIGAECPDERYVCQDGELLAVSPEEGCSELVGGAELSSGAEVAEGGAEPAAGQEAGVELGGELGGEGAAPPGGSGGAETLVDGGAQLVAGREGLRPIEGGEPGGAAPDEPPRFASAPAPATQGCSEVNTHPNLALIMLLLALLFYRSATPAKRP